MGPRPPRDWSRRRLLDTFDPRHAHDARDGEIRSARLTPDSEKRARRLFDAGKLASRASKVVVHMRPEYQRCLARCFLKDCTSQTTLICERTSS